MTREIHFSELQSFWRCRYQWYLKYVLGLDTEPNDAMRAGSAWEAVAYAFLIDGEQAAIKCYNDIVEQNTQWNTFTGDEGILFIPKLLPAFIGWFKATGYGVHQVQAPLDVQLGDPIVGAVTVVGTADILFGTADNELIVGELKYEGTPRTDHLLLDPQGRTYVTLLNEQRPGSNKIHYIKVRKADPARTKLPLIVDRLIEHPQAVLFNTAGQIIATVQEMERTRANLDLAFRLANPLAWMDCYCGLKNECISRLLRIEEGQVDGV